jgi:hypothetical protein
MRRRAVEGAFFRIELNKGFRPLRGRLTFFAAAKKVTKESGFPSREQQLVA